jgi:uncharacterized protein (DUF1684 family)
VTISDWDLLDWRRRVFGLYELTRATARDISVEAAHDLWRSGRDELLRTHAASPVRPDRRAAFPGAQVAPYDHDYRFLVKIEAVDAVRREVMTETDGMVAYRRIGRITLPNLGTLDTWWIAGYGGGLFLPVKDATSGIQTYGGGRYLLDTIKGADLGSTEDGLVVDLNFAYQPSCAYEESWVCPLPGLENTLAAVVPVGELYQQA